MEMYNDENTASSLQMEYHTTEELLNQLRQTKRNTVAENTVKAVRDCFVALDMLPTSNKEEETMNYAYAQASIPTPVDTEKEKTSYLLSRLNCIRNEKETDLSNHFGFNWDKSPDNPKELVEKILAGDYWFPKYDDFGEIFDEEDLGTSGHPFFGIRWGKKGFKPDRKGYEAASEKLSDAYQTAKDEITISTPEKGLETLRAFESATFH